jgi:Holliday junction resolvase RusA-like endonuclease
MTFDLPMPPSVNNMYATFNGRRIPSREFKAWKADAADKLGAQYAAYGAPAVHRPVALSIRVGLNYRGDISNRIKAIEDLLSATLDMPDDRYTDRIVIERDQAVTGAVVTVGSAVDSWQSFGEVARGVVQRIAEDVE